MQAPLPVEPQTIDMVEHSGLGAAAHLPSAPQVLIVQLRPSSQEASEVHGRTGDEDQLSSLSKLQPDRSEMKAHNAGENINLYQMKPYL